MTEAIEILRAIDATCEEKMPTLHVVFGDYRGPIDAKVGEKVVFVGDCVQWSGRLAGSEVEVKSCYRSHEGRDPRRAKHEDIYAKMAQVTATLANAQGRSYLRLPGCPVSVAEQVLALAQLGGTKNPYLQGDEVLRFNRAYLRWRLQRALNRLRGERYQRGAHRDPGERMSD